MDAYLGPLLGGMLLGLGLALPLVMFGYAEGASGMIHGIAAGSVERRRFRWVLEASMLLTGLACAQLWPEHFAGGTERSNVAIAVAGVLVGFGAKQSNGCTSGHGVLGVGRGSLRSLVAVSLFSLSATVVASVWPPDAEPNVNACHKSQQSTEVACE